MRLSNVANPVLVEDGRLTVRLLALRRRSTDDDLDRVDGDAEKLIG
jgi:hypothetical protein